MRRDIICDARKKMKNENNIKRAIYWKILLFMQQLFMYNMDSSQMNTTNRAKAHNLKFFTHRESHFGSFQGWWELKMHKPSISQQRYKKSGIGSFHDDAHNHRYNSFNLWLSIWHLRCAVSHFEIRLPLVDETMYK